MRQTWPNRTLITSQDPLRLRVQRVACKLDGSGPTVNRRRWRVCCSQRPSGPDNPHCGVACAGLDLSSEFGAR